MTVNDQDPYSQEPLDSDPDETSEWQESLQQLVQAKGHGRGREIMLSLLQTSHELQLNVPQVPTTDYINTIAPENEPEFPGDEELERRYRRWIRWNAAVTVHRAQRPGIGVGGHISTYASSASLYEVGFNHFFRGLDDPNGGDQIFIQGHASPGIYARSFLEGRLTEEQLDGFRQEKSKAPNGIPSYPHPRLMPEYWQFPTVSMGLGPINAIYQAMTNKYLTNRGIKDLADSHVWAFLGDGEMDEVESRGQLQVAANEGLDNLDVRRQLQPAAPRRPGARQRQDHPGARELLPRRRLERHQGRLGQRLGRAARQGHRRRTRAPHEHDARTATSRPTAPRTAGSSASTSSGATSAPRRW